MVRLGECPACRFGNHKRHVRNYAPAPEGVMGGAVCLCEGECVERGPDRHAAKQINLIDRAFRKVKR